jgi:hypothetical protein
MRRSCRAAGRDRGRAGAYRRRMQASFRGMPAVGRANFKRTSENHSIRHGAHLDQAGSRGRTVGPGTFSQATTYEKDHGRRSAQRHFPQSSSTSRRTAAASGYVKTVGRTLEFRKDGGGRLVSEPPTPPPTVILDGLGFLGKPQEAIAPPLRAPVERATSSCIHAM